MNFELCTFICRPDIIIHMCTILIVMGSSYKAFLMLKNIFISACYRQILSSAADLCNGLDPDQDGLIINLDPNHLIL